MKRFKWVSIIGAAAVLMAPGAMAYGPLQEAGAYASWLNAGDLDNGFGIGLKYRRVLENVEFKKPGLELGFDIRAGWLMFNGDDNDHGMDVNLFPVEITALLSYETIDGARPYAGIGGGYYLFSASGSALDVDNDIGFYLLAGWNQPVGVRAAVFAEAKYLWLEPELQGPHDFADDLDVSGFGIQLGVNFEW